MYSSLAPCGREPQRYHRGSSQPPVNLPSSSPWTTHPSQLNCSLKDGGARVCVSAHVCQRGSRDSTQKSGELTNAQVKLTWKSSMTRQHKKRACGFRQRLLFSCRKSISPGAQPLFTATVQVSLQWSLIKSVKTKLEVISPLLSWSVCVSVCVYASMPKCEVQAIGMHVIFLECVGIILR